MSLKIKIFCFNLLNYLKHKLQGFIFLSVLWQRKWHVARHHYTKLYLRLDILMSGRLILFRRKLIV